MIEGVSDDGLLRGVSLFSVLLTKVDKTFLEAFVSQSCLQARQIAVDQVVVILGFLLNMQA